MNDLELLQLNEMQLRDLLSLFDAQIMAVEAMGEDNQDYSVSDMQAKRRRVEMVLRHRIGKKKARKVA